MRDGQGLPVWRLRGVLGQRRRVPEPLTPRLALAAVGWRLPSLWACIAVHFANNAWNGGLISALTRSFGQLANRMG